MNSMMALETIMMILRASQGWLILAMVIVEVPWPVRYMSFGVIIVSNHIPYTVTTTL